MTEDFRKLARDLFVACVNSAPDERMQKVREGCANDRVLEKEVINLLEAHDSDSQFLETPAANFSAKRPAAETESTISMSPSVSQESWIGPYRLLHEIGEGGFGVVYMAEQTKPVRRKVALKVVKPGMDTRQVVSRFEAERQVLAIMDHPNIAKVLDVGTTDSTDGSDVISETTPGRTSGRPYFVMELVHGIPITEFCDEQQLDIRQRLVLFIDVCRAVQHAHQKGIIHRDLKPSNVLTTMNDGRPMPKIIDFGIAKALTQQLTDRTQFTAYGQLVGTPLYMSPEQAQFGGTDVDTRSDIYSLGVLLYELLTGETPFDKETLQGSGLDEMRRVIQEVDPPRPSVRVGMLDAESQMAIPCSRSTTHRKLTGLLRGELDWIVMKAMEKNRSRRYQSASDLAADIEGYLKQEAISAGPPSPAYKIKKLLVRNRARALTALLVSALLFTGIGVSVRNGLVAAHSRSQVQHDVQQWMSAARTAIELNEFDIARQHISKAQGRIAPVHQTLPLLTADLEQLANQIEERTSQQQRLQQFEKLAREAMDAMSYSEGTTGKERALQALKLYDIENNGSRDGLAPDHISTLSQPQQEQLKRDLYQVLLALADCEIRWGPKEERPKKATLSLNLLEQSRRFHPPTRAFYWVRSECHRLLQNEEAAQRDRETFQNTVAVSAFDYFLPGHTAAWKGDLEEAIRSYELALRIQPDHFNSLFYLGVRLIATGRRAEAAQVWRSCLVLRPDHIPTLRNRALVLCELGKTGEALDSISKVLKLPSESTSALAYGVRGMIYQKSKKYDRALADYDKAADLATRFGPEQAIAMAHNARAWLLATCPDQSLRNEDRALELAHRAVELAPESGANWNTLGVAQYRVSDPVSAIESLTMSLEKSPSAGFAINCFFLAMAHHQIGNKAQAQNWYDKAVKRLAADKSEDEESLRFQAEAQQTLAIETPE